MLDPLFETGSFAREIDNGPFFCYCSILYFLGLTSTLPLKNTVRIIIDDRVPCNRVAYDDEKRFEPSFLKSQAWGFLCLGGGLGLENLTFPQKMGAGFETTT